MNHAFLIVFGMFGLLEAIDDDIAVVLCLLFGERLAIDLHCWVCVVKFDFEMQLFIKIYSRVRFKFILKGRSLSGVHAGGLRVNLLSAEVMEKAWP